MAHSSSLLACALLALTAAGCGPDSNPESNAQAQPQGNRELGDGFAGGESVTYEPLDIPEDAQTVAFLGDSITAGLHLTPEEAYPAAVQRILAKSGSPFHLVNAGVSGDTTQGGLARLPYLLENTKPDVLVVELGANDGLRATSPAAALEMIDRNLREIIRLAREADARPILLGMDLPTNLGDFAKDFSQLYLDISAELDVPLIEHFLSGVGGVPDMNLRDGMHPSAAGHQRLAENIQAAVGSLLSRESSLIAPSGR